MDALVTVRIRPVYRGEYFMLRTITGMVSQGSVASTTSPTSRFPLQGIRAHLTSSRPCKQQNESQAQPGTAPKCKIEARSRAERKKRQQLDGIHKLMPSGMGDVACSSRRQSRTGTFEQQLYAPCTTRPSGIAAATIRSMENTAIMLCRG